MCIRDSYHPSHPEYRAFGHENMKWDVAKKAIDFLKEHSQNAENRHIGFYGGEPLLNFELIERAVEYAKKLFGEDMSFAITTNATLVNDKIAEYFAKNNFNIIISLDGPQEMHDVNRLMVNGTGSFEKTVMGAKKLFEAFHKEGKSSKIGFNTVSYTHLDVYKRQDLQCLLAQVVDEIYPSLSAKGNSAAFTVDDDLVVYADPEKLARVFSNLLKNAAAYSYPNTEIIITAKRCGNSVQINFENHGRTIEPEQISGIFEKFNRLDEARLSDTGGAGLGPVSYTHLDVYKRQLLIWIGQIKIYLKIVYSDMISFLPSAFCRLTVFE